jgi:hypothetical protein
MSAKRKSPRGPASSSKRVRSRRSDRAAQEALSEPPPSSSQAPGRSPVLDDQVVEAAATIRGVVQKALEEVQSRLTSMISSSLAKVGRPSGGGEAEEPETIEISDGEGLCSKELEAEDERSIPDSTARFVNSGIPRLTRSPRVEELSSEERLGVSGRVGQNQVSIGDMPPILCSVGFPSAVAEVFRRNPKTMVDLELFQSCNFQHYARRVWDKRSGDDFETKASRALTSTESPVSAMRRDDHLLLLKCLQLWAMVVDWASGGSLAQEAFAHVYDVTSLIPSPFESESSRVAIEVPFLYDRMRREAWYTGGRHPLGVRDEHSVRLATTQVKATLATTQVKAALVSNRVPRLPVALVSKPCFDFNGLSGCSRLECRYQHSCSNCGENHSLAAGRCRAGGSSRYGGAPSTWFPSGRPASSYTRRQNPGPPHAFSSPVPLTAPPSHQ